MSIPWRAARKPLFGKSEDTPGPDAYELQNVGRPKSTPPYVAFHTTSNRSDIAKGASGAGVAPGSYNIKWNAIGYPTGVYFARLNYGSKVRTQKIIFLK